MSMMSTAEALRRTMAEAEVLQAKFTGAEALRGAVLEEEEYMLTWNLHSTHLVQDLYKHCMVSLLSNSCISTDRTQS
jgi:hypothetical protein